MKKNKCLPFVYWLPRVHKNPRKARFIIATPKSSLKPVSESLAAVFKMHFHQTENYYNWTRTHNHLVRKQTLNHLGKLAK